MAQAIPKLGETGAGAAQAFGLAELDACLDNRHFRVEYQPKIALLNTQISQFGVEALCRVTHPELGAIPPDRFIPIAENGGLIPKLTDAVVCEAFGAWRSWAGAGLHLRLALNVSPLLLGDEEWATRFLERAAQFRMDAKFITLEITETAAGATSDLAVGILTRLQKKGFSLSIDDFGTGFSSLATLYRLPIAEMKIDKSFIFDLEGRPGARELVESAIAMAKRMNIKVVAEGVESESVFQELRRIGCDEVQGYFVGKAMPAEKIIPFFTDWKKTRPAKGGMPKVAIVQALLNELSSDVPASAPAAAAGPYRSQAAPASGGSDPTRETLRKIPPLVLEGKTLPALSACQEAAEALAKITGRDTMRARLAELQERLEEELLTARDLEMLCAQGRYRLLPRDSATVGRVAPTAKPDINVKCRWFGTAERNLRLFHQDGQFFIEDLGSTHGHVVGGVRLAVKRAQEIAFGRTLVEVRMASGTVAPLALLLQRNSADPEALLVGFDYDAGALRADLGEREWQALKPDLASTWVLFQGKFRLGRSPECALVLADCQAQLAATISFEKGAWITPEAGVEFKADGAPFRRRLPLARDCNYLLAGSELAVSAGEGSTAAAQSTPAVVRL